MEKVRSSLSLHWVSVHYFTRGWGTFFEQEYYGLSVLCTLACIIDVLRGNSLFCMLSHMILIVLIRRILAGGICTSTKRLDGKTVIITGCNVGIGRETARDLSRRGAKIIMACRDTKTAEKVAKEISSQTGGQLVVMKLDLASLTSVRALAASVKSQETQIHMLINNAGVMMCPFMKTEDGFEMQMGTNHLGHFLLTCLLLPLLTHSEPACIITVSSLAHAGSVIRFDDMNNEKDYNRLVAYGRSKLANILFTRQLAKRLKGTNIQVFSVHPGIVQSNLGRHIVGGLSAWSFSTILLKTTIEGIQTTLHCALEANQEDPYYYSDCSLGHASPEAQDDEAAEKLWLISEKMVGLTKEQNC
ncbi:retinol dehydrogenase 12-like isoform X2 [Panulirus ornatus]|uniref:retinol dehydrogenase 12-like isoform X2 n=1 Tax=Panulirus ornatus TaxID=150431 RepID=UPI003A87F72F